MSTTLPFLGRGLIRPFRRNLKGDFTSAQGAELVKAAVIQVIGTRGAVQGAVHQGEIPWRTEFGSLVHLLRHAPNSAILGELARTYVVDALQRWEPRIVVRDVTAQRQPTAAGAQRALLIRTRFNLIDTNIPGNVLFPDDLTTEQVVPLG